MSNEMVGYEKRYKATSPWLGMSVAYQVSVDAARVYESIRNGAIYMEDIVADTNIPAGEISPFMKELMDVGAVIEDDDDLPDTLGLESLDFHREKGYDFSVSSLPDLFAVNKKNLDRARDELRKEKGKPKPMPTNLMNIMGDDNLAAIVTPNQPVSKTPSQEEIIAFMQQMAMAQQQMTQQQQLQQPTQ